MFVITEPLFINAERREIISLPLIPKMSEGSPLSIIAVLGVRNWRNDLLVAKMLGVIDVCLTKRRHLSVRLFTF